MNFRYNTTDIKEYKFMKYTLNVIFKELSAEIITRNIQFYGA